MKERITYALILSGGSGNRFGDNLPKQFADIYGKSILHYCISNFEKHPLIDKIIVVSNPEHIQRTKQIAINPKFKKVISVIEGGATRGESSFLGIKQIAQIAIETDNINVLIQDAVRPNTNESIISNVVSGLKTRKAVTVAVATTDTIYIADDKDVLSSIPDRKKLFKAQTPQGFHFDLIFSAYEKLEKVSRFKLTDDSSVINKIYPNEDIKIITGDANNLKITFQEDLEYFRQIL